MQHRPTGNASAPPPGRGRRPLRRKLLWAAGMLALAVIWLMDGTRQVGSYMPFFVERNLAARYVNDLPPPSAYSRALEAFAEKIAAVQGLPPEINVQVHVIPEDSLQGFATLGGHILLYEGLLRALHSEDELAALLAHQVAHLAMRHPAEALGRRVSVGLVLSMISKDWADALADPSFHASLRTPPRFLEEHEADTLAATGETLHSLYGHLGGAKALAATLRGLQAAARTQTRNVFDTHPAIAALDEALTPLIQERGWIVDDPKGTRRPLPPALTLAPVNAAVPAPAAPVQ